MKNIKSFISEFNLFFFGIIFALFLSLNKRYSTNITTCLFILSTLPFFYKFIQFSTLRFFRAAPEKNKIKQIILFFILVSIYSSLIACLMLNLPAGEKIVRLIHKQSERLLQYIFVYIFFFGLLFAIINSIIDKKIIRAFTLSIIAILWAVYSQTIYDYITLVNIDSLMEINDFDFKEAIFFIETIHSNVRFSSSIKTFVKSFIYGLIFYYIIYRNIKKRRIFDDNKNEKKKIYIISFLLIILSVGVFWGNMAFEIIESRILYKNIDKNFSGEINEKIVVTDSPLVIVYIGESTGTMNMSAYNYVRNTTPNLKKMKQNDPNIVFFNNVFSTHTHTNPSLLEALSLPLEENSILPVYRQKRSALPDILGKSSIPTFLISNQGQNGVHDRGANVIFKHAYRTYNNKKQSGYSPFDHDLFAKYLPETVDNIDKSQAAVIFLHSYAGHGPYHEIIPPEFRKPVDTFLESSEYQAISGKKLKNRKILNNIDSYDSAIRYIDFSLNQTIKYINSLDRPVIFIYFSDHGESVYTGWGHDSARFTHEMARIPFIIYFNNFAKNHYSETFKKYKSLGENNTISLLSQFPDTLLDLMNAKTSKKLNIIGSSNNDKTKLILIREDKNRYNTFTYINLGTEKVISPDNKYKFEDKTDTATRFFAQTFRNNTETQICYHRSNSFAKAIRGAMTASCIEADFVLQDDNAINVYHPPLKTVNLQAETIIEIAKKYNRSLWLDMKNIDSAKSCETFRDFLSKQKINGEKYLIEIPPHAQFHDVKMKACLNEIKHTDARLSYYVPTDQLIACKKAIKSGNSIMENADCQFTENALKRAYESQVFSDISFDYSGIEAIEAIPETQHFRWNTWGIAPEQFSTMNKEKFRFVIANASDDPNTR
ncbi:phosphoethanolamine transferase [Oxalobacter sp. OttesenSCG-928-P03]|nr:phosphoethanolamine transferase [Oxalobacter sp. OttesenSCG-928-P03]